jgi:hypothetical protein
LTLPVGDWFVFTTWAVFAPTMPDPFPPAGCPPAPPLSAAEQAQLQSYDSALILGCALGVSAGSLQTIACQDVCLVATVGVNSSEGRTSAPPTLHMVCQGPAVNDSPTVVLIAGDGDSLTVWRPIQGPLARHLRACAHDRRHRTLSAHNIDGPRVLVGHSLGGDVAITYGHRYPAAVRSGGLATSPGNSQGFRPA